MTPTRYPESRKRAANPQATSVFPTPVSVPVMKMPLPIREIPLFLSGNWLGSVGSQELHMRVRGPAEQAEGTETERCGKSRDPLPSAREAGPRTVFPTTKHRSEGMGNLSSTLRY